MSLLDKSSLYGWLLVVCLACQHKTKQQATDLTSTLSTASVKAVGAQTYYNVYQQATDSVQSWVANKLTSANNQRANDWSIDSLICFNPQADKCVMALETRLTHFPAADHDGIHYFYGVKIGGRWYFFYGPYLVVSRATYQEDGHQPLSFNILHKAAVEHIFGAYLQPDGRGGWQINEGFFARFYQSDAYNYPFTTQHAWEQSWLKLMRENWQQRDTSRANP